MKKIIFFIFLCATFNGSANQVYKIEFPPQFSHLNSKFNLSLNQLTLHQTSNSVSITSVNLIRLGKNLPGLTLCEQSTPKSMNWVTPTEDHSSDDEPRGNALQDIRQKSWYQHVNLKQWDGFYFFDQETHETSLVSHPQKSSDSGVTVDSRGNIVSAKSVPLLLLVYKVAQDCWESEMHNTNLARDPVKPDWLTAAFYLLKNKNSESRHFVNLPIVMSPLKSSAVEGLTSEK